MKRTGTTLFPLSIAHLAGLGAVQCAIALAFIDPDIAVLPLSAFVIFCIAAPFFPRFGFYLPVTSRGKSGGNAVALTFDDGPDPRATPALLDLLSRYSVPATFFVTGRNASRHPEIIRAILERGHLIGNHSYNHNPFLMLKSGGSISRDIESAQKVLSSFGVSPRAFRPPVGVTGPRLWRALLEQGLHCVNFSLRAGDFGNRRYRGISKKILGRIRGGDIVLLHDVSPPDGPEGIVRWLEEVEKILAGISGRGLRVVQLDGLIGRPVMKRSGVEGNPIAGFYDALAPEYEREQCDWLSLPLRTRERELALSRIERLISRRDRVLEIGAGTGAFSIPIAKRCSELLAIDLSEEMLRILKKKAGEAGLSNITVHAGDVSTMAPGVSINAICAFSSFEYIADIEGLIRRLCQWLEPGGVLFFPTAHRSLFRLFAQIGNAMRQGIWLHARGKSEIQGMLRRAGFAEIEVATHVFKVFGAGGMLLEACARK